jgi:hypothetical protein
MGWDLDIPRAALVAFVLVVGLAFVAGGVTSSASFNAFNPAWDGTSDFRTIAEEAGSEPVIARDTTRYSEHGANTTAVILSPDRNYTETDVARIRTFLQRGGTLVVADRDGPHGHTLLEDLGAAARPVGPILRDERNYYRSPALPVAEAIGNHSLVDGVETLTLNYGTAVDPNGATVLVSTSGYTYLDRNGDGSLSEDETVASYPVATAEPVGNGTVVTVGDPSVFINVMQDREGNRAFSRALVNGTAYTLVDISRTTSPPPLVALLLTIRESTVLQLALGLGGFVVLRVGSGQMRRESVTHP